MKLARTKEWRESHGLTQRELAAEAGVGEVTVARIEADASVSPPTARKVADALSVSVADLLERPPVPLAEAPDTGPAVTPGVVDEPEEGLSPIALPHDSLRTPELLLEQLHEHGIRTNRSEVSVLCQIIGMSDELVEDESVDHERVGWLLAAAALFGLLTEEGTKVARETARGVLASEQSTRVSRGSV